MKYLVVSDIHGDASSVEFIKNIYEKGNFECILNAGDILYHGPRNDLPKDYNPKLCIKLLNELKNNIIAVWGNCEAEVDQMVLDFKINKDIDLNINNMKCHMEHGHHLDLYEGKADIIISGHTHIPVLKRENNIIYLNPGSISIPKGGFERSYAIIDDKKITIYDINNKIIYELEI